MIITTVGELIEVLQQFDPNLPVLKADECAVCYAKIELLPGMTFAVKQNHYPGSSEIVDCDPGDTGFAAVVL